MLDLTQKCLSVKFPLDHDLVRLIDQMKQSLKYGKGVFKDEGLGLSANQLGFCSRIIVIAKDIKNIDTVKEYDVYINPVIEFQSECTIKLWEGCVSNEKQV